MNGKMEMTAVTVRVPAGAYYLGDPCYAVPNDLWMELLGTCDFFGVPVGSAGGHQVVAFRTAWGDGLYQGSDGFQYPVDAGLIGLVPIALNPAFDRQDLVSLVVYERATECSTDGNGGLMFGGVEIDTAKDWEEEEDDEGEGDPWGGDDDDD